MNEGEMLSVIQGIARDGNAHRCSCPETVSYATGNPPDRYWSHAVKMASSLGWGLRHSHDVYDMRPGAQGHSVGWVPDHHSHPRRQACILPWLPPAQDFFVTAHEMAHIMLQHPPLDHIGSRAQQWSMLLSGINEDFSQEASAQLAAAACAVSAGMRVMEGNLCYLGSRVVAHRRMIGEAEEYAALLAGKEIACAMICREVIHGGEEEQEFTFPAPGVAV